MRDVSFTGCVVCSSKCADAGKRYWSLCNNCASPALTHRDGHDILVSPHGYGMLKTDDSAVAIEAVRNMLLPSMNNG